MTNAANLSADQLHELADLYVADKRAAHATGRGVSSWGFGCASWNAVAAHLHAFVSGDAANVPSLLVRDFDQFVAGC